MSLRRVAALALLAAASAPVAQDRPPEEELFGQPAEEPPRPAQPAPQPAPKATPQAERSKPGPPAAEAAKELEPEPGAEGRLLGRLNRTENPLQIGGLLYLRSNVSSREHTPPSQWTLTVPTLTDVYLDARPIDRVRAFALGRMLFDPTAGSSASVAPGLTGATASAPSNPRVLLDQLWLRFDVARTVFLTVGRQHVKWGVGRFWNPTDFLHAQRRDPLALFDDRTGTTMIRAHLPWEARGWNFYGVAIFEQLVTQPASPFLSSAGGGSSSLPSDGTQAGTGSQLGKVGGGARAEVVLGSWELGVDAVAQRGIRPRFGFDVSGGLWELDVRGEVALRTGSDVPLFQGTLAAPASREPTGVRPQAVVGVDWSRKYSDEDTFTVGLEYFYNANGYGYGDRGLYPLLIAANAFTPFYLGQHYAGAFLLLPKPGSWNLHSFTLSALANLSDRSGLARLDWSMTLLTYLTLEAYLQTHFGTKGGEFRLAIDVPANPAIGLTSPVFVGAPVVDLGLALRVSL